MLYYLTLSNWHALAFLMVILTGWITFNRIFIVFFIQFTIYCMSCPFKVSAVVLFYFYSYKCNAFQF